MHRPKAFDLLCPSRTNDGIYQIERLKSQGFTFVGPLKGAFEEKTYVEGVWSETAF
jgi:DNA-binding transcriptional regulator of glucitol operon